MTSREEKFAMDCEGYGSGSESRYSIVGDRTPEPEHADIPAAYFNDLWEYHLGVGGQGKHAFTWSDKPHRLVYDLTCKLAEERASRSENQMTAPQSDDKDELVTPLNPTNEMIEAGAQRLVRWETGNEKWPDAWSALDVRASRNDAERVWRSMWLAASVPECGTIDMNAARKEAGNTGEFRDAIIARSGATPRTDKAAFRMRPFLEETAELVNADFARQLERELAHERKRAEAFKEAMLSYEQAARAERDGAVSASGKREFTAAEQIAMVKKAGYDKTKGHPDCYMDFSYSLLFAEIASRSTSGLLETYRAALQKIADDYPRSTNEGAQEWARTALSASGTPSK